MPLWSISRPARPRSDVAAPRWHSLGSRALGPCSTPESCEVAGNSCRRQLPRRCPRLCPRRRSREDRRDLGGLRARRDHMHISTCLLYPGSGKSPAQTQRMPPWRSHVGSRPGWMGNGPKWHRPTSSWVELSCLQVRGPKRHRPTS